MKGWITMKKAILFVLLLIAAVVLLAACSRDKDDGLIVVGIINNPPSESGYREANVKDFERVFTEENGYDARTFYSNIHYEQLNKAREFIADEVDYLLISAASSDGWESVLRQARDAGIRVFFFDRMINVPDDLFEAAVISDMARQGNMAVSWLREQNLPEFNVVHIQGEMGTDAQIGRTAALDREFAAGTMNKVEQLSADWSEEGATRIVEAVIASGVPFNVIYAENDGMARGAVTALAAAGISHGVDRDVIIIGFDANKWALRELLAGNWNYNGQCSPFQAAAIDEMIKILESGGRLTTRIVISDEKGFDARTITQEDIDTYGLGD
jgi:simple sugar transport system substrate-binding protein